MQRIAINQESPYFRFATELEGRTFTLTFRWNSRVQQWRMDLGDGEGNLLIVGIGCVLGVPLLENAQGEQYPPGVFFFIDTTGQNREMAYEDLGRRVELVYVTGAEL